MNHLNNGFVVERLENKERVRVCTPAKDQECFVCFKGLKGIKCLRHEKGNIYLLYECFDCHQRSNREAS